MSFQPPEQRPDSYGAPYGTPVGGPPPARVGCARRVAGIVLIVFGVLLFLSALLNRMAGAPIPSGARGTGYVIGFLISLGLSGLLVWGGIRLQRIRRR